MNCLKHPLHSEFDSGRRFREPVRNTKRLQVSFIPTATRLLNGKYPSCLPTCLSPLLSRPVCLSLSVSCSNVTFSRPVFRVVSFSSPVSSQPVHSCVPMCFHFPRHPSAYLLSLSPSVFCQCIFKSSVLPRVSMFPHYFQVFKVFCI